MAVWKKTRSGYEFPVLKARELVAQLADGDYWTWGCGEKHCPVTVQGGRNALRIHYQVCHPEIPAP